MSKDTTALTDTLREPNMSHAQVKEAYNALTKYGSKAPPLSGILLAGQLRTLLRLATEEADFIELSTSQAQEHVVNRLSGQKIPLDPATANLAVFEAMRAKSAFQDPGIRLTKKHLPKLPEFSDDPEKQAKAVEARSDLANIISSLGYLFDHGAGGEE